MADNNPFESLFDPSRKGTITGLVGRAMGNRSPDQIRGEAVANAYKKIGELQASGLDPQKAVVQFFQSEDGQNFFARNPDGIKQLTEYMQAASPATRQNMVLSPGQQAFDPSGKPIASVPAAPQRPHVVGNALVDDQGNVRYQSKPTDVQKFEHFSNLAQLPPDRIKELAQLQLDPSKTPSDKRVAVDRLVRQFGLDAATGEGILAGTIKVLPIKDQYGQDTGDVSVTDLAKLETDPANAVRRLSARDKPLAPGMGVDTQGQPVATQPGTTPETGAAAGIIPPVQQKQVGPKLSKDYFGDKADMFLSSGVLPNVMAGVSNVTEQVHPSLVIPEGSKSKDRQRKLDALRQVLTSVATSGEGFGINKSVIEANLRLVPTGSTLETPHEAVTKGINLYDNVQQEIAAEEAKISRTDLPRQERINAAKRMEMWRKVERHLPTRDQLLNMEQAIRDGTADAVTIPRVAQQTKEAVTKAGERLQGDIQGPDFSKMSRDQLISVDRSKLTRDQWKQILDRIKALQSGAK